ncbi:hypothetical protein [Pseudomonas fluorescens]|uniref:hypothetical protein n=1 Tax=Pseudomonas fluorescens TaxID=294 RepID=UPI003F7A1DFD
MSRVRRIQYRMLLVGGQQRGSDLAALALLLRQQLIVVPHDAALHTALYFGGQACFAVIALSRLLIEWRAIDQAIKWVVVVAA